MRQGKHAVYVEKAPLSKQLFESYRRRKAFESRGSFNKGVGLCAGANMLSA